MKNTLNMLMLVIMTMYLCCGLPANFQGNSISKSDSISDSSSINEHTNEVKKIDKENRIDSLRLDFALNHAFKVAQEEFNSDNFKREYEIQPDDSSYTIKIEIEIGMLFNNNQKYFLLRRHVPWATYLDLYNVRNNKAVKLIYRVQGGMTYIKDTIQDVNGDGYKDFLVHWYPSSGCCRRDVYNVYLYLPNNGNFTKDYEFINPTFSAKEKIIRGVEYGHPGEVGLYKYKWNGFKVDTIEFIYPDVNNKGQFIKTKKEAYLPTDKQGIVLKSVPSEYLNIESYEWFSDF